MNNNKDRRVKLVLFDEDGKEVGVRYQRFFPDEMGASEYGLGLKAKELYRDWLFANNLWDTFRKQEGRGSFWS